MEKTGPSRVQFSQWLQGGLNCPVGLSWALLTVKGAKAAHLHFNNYECDPSVCQAIPWSCWVDSDYLSVSKPDNAAALPTPM